jgi:hypothetical protein
MIVAQNEEGYDIVQTGGQHWTITKDGVVYRFGSMSTAIQTRLADYPAIRCPDTLKYKIAC